MASSKKTSKYQEMISKKEREESHLNVEDKEYLRTVQNTLIEWESENDEKAFKHLQVAEYYETRS